MNARLASRTLRFRNSHFAEVHSPIFIQYPFLELGHFDAVVWLMLFRTLDE